MPDKPERSWPKRLIIAVLRPIYIILLRPFARPLARRLRGFFLIPVNEQMSALRHDLAELNLKFGSIVSTLQVLEGKAGEAEQGMQRSRQRLQTEMEALRESMQQVEKGEPRAHEDMQRLKADVESVRQSMQGLEGSTNDIRRDVKNEISAMGRSIQAVLASLSVASERP
jgi:DNA repair exonuclease SbcCD ATPase subunit